MNIEKKIYINVGLGVHFQYVHPENIKKSFELLFLDRRKMTPNNKNKEGKKKKKLHRP